VADSEKVEGDPVLLAEAGLHSRAGGGHTESLLDEMPLNPTGKIDRNGLKQIAEDHLHPHLDSDR
jgi:hypothetical protein